MGGEQQKGFDGVSCDVRKFFGHALDFAQRGGQHDAAKVLKGFGGAGVLEVVEDGAGGTYRAVYTVKFEEAVFCPALLPEEEQARNRDAERGHGHHSHQTESGRDACKGATK